MGEGVGARACRLVLASTVSLTALLAAACGSGDAKGYRGPAGSAGAAGSGSDAAASAGFGNVQGHAGAVSNPGAAGSSTRATGVGGAEDAGGAVSNAGTAGSSTGGTPARGTCNDSVKNGNEADVDCGGECAVSCEDGESCRDDSDCSSRHCSAATQRCTTPTCSDGIRNGSETDVDCGGGCEARCPDGKGCETPADCVSELCWDERCVEPGCSNGILDERETDLDCGGPDCGTSCENGQTCGADGDCVSGYCTSAHTCATPRCDDGVQNGDETGVDCRDEASNTCPQCPGGGTGGADTGGSGGDAGSAGFGGSSSGGVGDVAGTAGTGDIGATGGTSTAGAAGSAGSGETGGSSSGGTGETGGSSSGGTGGSGGSSSAGTAGSAGAGEAAGTAGFAGTAEAGGSCTGGVAETGGSSTGGVGETGGTGGSAGAGETAGTAGTAETGGSSTGGVAETGGSSTGGSSTGGVGETGGTGGSAGSAGSAGTGETGGTGGSPDYTPNSEYLLEPDLAIDVLKSLADFRTLARDDVNGGFFSYVKVDGTVGPNRSKGFVTSSRDAWTFSRAFMVTGDEVYLDHAAHALEHLFSHGWDSTYGGWYFTGDEFGVPSSINGTKSAFVQHYALLGIGAYCDATREATVCDWFQSGRSVLDTAMWDSAPSRLGYYDQVNRNLTNPTNKGFTATVDALTTNGMQAELLWPAAYHQRMVDSAGIVVDRLAANMDLSIVKFGFPELYDANWNVMTSNTANDVGHVLKSSWVLARAYLRNPDARFRTAARKFIYEVLDNGGYDDEHGVPYTTANWSTGSQTLKAECWQIEQAITGGLSNWYIADSRTDANTYLEMADRALQFFIEYVIDHTYGGTWKLNNLDGTPSGSSKSNLYNVEYHSTETFWFTYLYGNLLLHREPVALYYMVQPAEAEQTIQLNPVAVDDDSLQIQAVTLDGESLDTFDGPTREVTLAAGQGGKLRVVFGPAS